MSVIAPAFFKGNEYFVDEKIGLFKFTNQYKIYNPAAEHIGTMRQVMSGGQKVLRLVLNKAIMPFKLEIVDTNGHVLGTIHRGWTFWMSKITLTGPNGQNIGNIKQKFRLFKSKFEIMDEAGQKMAEVNGDWKAWTFTITDAQGNELGKITKKWAGIGKEVFTSADKYVVSTDPLVQSELQKLRVLCIAITMDMLLKEK